MVGHQNLVESYSRGAGENFALSYSLQILPPPKPYYFGRTSSPPPNLILLGNRESDCDFVVFETKKHPQSPNMTQSLQNVYCSRSLHNRNLGKFMLSRGPISRKTEDCSKSRPEEFEQLIQTLFQLSNTQ